MMSPEKQLKNWRNSSSPSSEYRRALWSRLSSTWDAEYPGMRTSLLRTFALPVALLAILVMTGTGVYAYSSPGVTSDTALYPVKHGIEAIEARLHNSPEARERFTARMRARRMEEGAVMRHREELRNIREHMRVRI